VDTLGLHPILSVLDAKQGNGATTVLDLRLVISVEGNVRKVATVPSAGCRPIPSALHALLESLAIRLVSHQMLSAKAAAVLGGGQIIQGSHPMRSANNAAAKESSETVLG
jgi:hypothetical protein